MRAPAESTIRSVFEVFCVLATNRPGSQVELGVFGKLEAAFRELENVIGMVEGLSHQAEPQGWMRGSTISVLVKDSPSPLDVF
jgi:hypothetical protein